MRRFLTETTAATSSTDRVLTSPAPSTAASEENEHEISDCHPPGDDIGRPERGACTGRRRAWPSETADHCDATADNVAAALAGGATAAVFAAGSGINVD